MVEIVQTPTRGTLPEGKSLHATVKFNMPLEWLDQPNGEDLTAQLAAREGRVFFQLIKRDGIPE